MRPPIKKTTCCCPKTTIFKAVGITKPSEVSLSCEEVESLDLKNNKGLDQVQAAKMMGISQSTFQRILTAANCKVADALVNGKTINIQRSNQSKN